MWAILSGIEGNIAALEAVLADIKRQQPVQTITAPSRRVVGVGNVGREPGKATYTLYSPYSDRLEFKKVYYGNKKGFGTRF